MNHSGHQKPTSKKSWAIRAINIVGAVTVTLAILWETGITSRGLQEWFKALHSVPVAKAPVQLPTKAIGVAPLAPKGNDSSVSPVPLPLILVHTQPGRTPQEGFAQIGVVRESPQTYQAGALLENGARLAEIHADYVLLKKAEHSVRLYIENSPALARNGDGAILMVGGIKPATSSVPITNREILTDYIRASPVYDGENLVGYQVYPGAKSAPFRQMGLQAGDIITIIDGSPLNDPTSAWGTLRQLVDGNVLSAMVKRHGSMEQLNLDGTFITRAEEVSVQGPTQAMLPPPTH